MNKTDKYAPTIRLKNLRYKVKRKFKTHFHKLKTKDKIMSERKLFVLDTNVIRSLDNPIHSEGGIAILKGNLAPKGSVIKAGRQVYKLI